jgi:hypothetical protein
MNLLFGLGFAATLAGSYHSDTVGQPVDIAPSAYQYRADRNSGANPPESWLALMHYANLPLNKPVDLKDPAIRHCLCGLLWEEIRPVQTLELTWPEHARRPLPGQVTVAALINQGASSSWWNNLSSVTQPAVPSISSDGRTYNYAIGQNTCGLVVAVSGVPDATHYDVPKVRVLVPDTWKKMDIEVEWGFDKSTLAKDYSGRIEAYDGRVGDIKPLAEDGGTQMPDGTSWRSVGQSSSRRGIRMSLLYMGTSKWRKRQLYTTQPDDVARTIVTLWTKAGSFSFLVADLENGPILAPEYGFFVRRTSALSKIAPVALRMTATPLLKTMDSIAGDSHLKGWGSGETPWIGSNTADTAIDPLGIDFPSKGVAMHPGQFVDAVTEWRSPIERKVRVTARLTHAQTGGNGIEWRIIHGSSDSVTTLSDGSTGGVGPVSAGLTQDAAGATVEVKAGDAISLVIGPKGDYRSDTTLVDWTIAEVGGQGRIWNLAKDVAANPLEGNPHADSLGNPGVWRFCAQMPPTSEGAPSDPPFDLGSRETSARAFEAQLKSRGLQTIREQTRAHEEQTWEGAVTATRGGNLPDVPSPPPGSEPPMQVRVPSGALTAQWNLGVWHLIRHCSANPQTGKLWFNDYPYGILGAESYLILSVLDQMGAHDAAADGFDQWLSLPLDREHPVGLFSEGRGALTFAVGPDGIGGNMDGIHAFGPGSIGWALTQHYWMTGDKAWLKANAPRMIANAQWMLRQRRVMSSAVPGGARLWCKGLQPALQVTPDSGGLWMQFYECEAYYWASVSRLAATIAVVDPKEGARLKAEADAYRKDLRASVERSIALSPVVPVRDGTFHSVVPFACYVRGLSTGAWGWQRDGSGSHVGPLYWDTVQTAAALVSPASLLPPSDVRVQGYLDVLEDRLLLENQNVGDRNWFFAGWQYQGGLERTANMHLAADDIPVFLRSFLNCYAVDILPHNGYIFNEHAVHGPPDKIFEEAAFLERFRNLLVMEDGANLWLARGTPRAWFEQGKRISVAHAPTQFGDVSYEIVSDVARGSIRATISLPSRGFTGDVLLRLRHPKGARMTHVTVNGRAWREFDATEEVVHLHGLSGLVRVEVGYS